MSDYNIQMKKNTNGVWENLYPYSKSTNIYDDTRHNTVDDVLSNFENSLSNFEKSLSNIVPFANYSPDPTGQVPSDLAFKTALSNLKDNETLLLQPNATYLVTKEIKEVRKGTVQIDGNGSLIKTNVALSDSDSGIGLNFEGVFKSEKTISSPVTKGTNIVTLSNTIGLAIGDIVFFHSSEQFNSNRSYYKKGGTFTVGQIDGNNVTITGSFPYDMQTCGVSVYSPITVRIKNLKIEALKVLPNGRFGLHIAYSVNSKLEDLFSDNFNHCYHLSHHYNTIVEHVRSGRSMFLNSGESYGFSSYMGTLLKISNSTFNSGRHGLEISGFENSFHTTLINVTASSEFGWVGFNMHESSYNLVAINCIFDRIGIANHTTMINCSINSSNGGNSQVKTGDKYNDTAFVFRDCNFSTNHRLLSARYATNVNDLGKYIGTLAIENCTTDGFLMLDFDDGEVQYRSIVVKNTRNVGVNNIQYKSRIQQLVFEDVVWDLDEPWISQGADFSSIIENIFLNRCRFINRYNVLRLTRFDKLVFDTCSTINLFPDSPTYELTSKDTNGGIGGIVKIINSELSRLTLSSDALNHLSLVNSTISRSSNTGSNIYIKKEAQMVDII